jgi:predicted RNase H-like HicB family nuclease
LISRELSDIIQNNIKLTWFKIKERANIMRQVVIYPGEDGWWVAECPSLPGCISQGETRKQAIANITEAIQGYVKALEEDSLPVPDERPQTLRSR